MASKPNQNLPESVRVNQAIRDEALANGLSQHNWLFAFSGPWETTIRRDAKEMPVKDYRILAQASARHQAQVDLRDWLG